MFKNTLKRLGAIVLALAMAMSVMMVSAFATGTWTAAEGQKLDYIEFNKTVTAGANVKAPVGTFEFTVAPADPTVTGDVTETRDGYPVTKGPADAVGNGSVSFTADTTKDTDTNSNYTQKVKLTFNVAKFTAPGIYKYTVTEVKPETGAIDGVDYDTDARILYVYVRNNATKNGYEVYGAAMVNGSNKSDTITNAYATNTLTVKKTVTGDQGDANKEFTFTVKVKGSNAAEKYVISVPSDNTGNVNVPAVVIGNESTVTFTLKSGQQAVIYGLSENDEYTVEEVTPGEGYTSTLATTSDPANSKMKGESEEVASDKIVEFVNNRDSSPVTGVIMNIAPYVLMVALAGGIAFFFLRRRNAE